MEKISTHQAEKERNAARTLLVIEQYKNLKSIAEGICRLVPLKGVSLLHTIYSESNRDVGDIDVLVYPPEQAEAFATCLEKAGYTRQFDYLYNSSALHGKQKIAFLARNPLETDVDVHTSFISKKFFRRHCGDFNRDALHRCRLSGPSEAFMDCIDEWIFLSQHACFHRFENTKWLKDLHLIFDHFNDEQRLLLAQRCEFYGFHRITLIACEELKLFSHKTYSLKLKQRGEDEKTLRTTRRLLHEPHGIVMKRIIEWLWEIYMIDSAKGRLSAYTRFIFPSSSEIRAIYRQSSSLVLPFLHLAHPIPALIALISFDLYVHCQRP